MASERVLSIVEATRLIYRTRTPTDQQIHRIYEQMKAGLLRTHQRGGSPLRWTTTEDALAEFLAANQVEKALGDPVIEAARRRGAAARGTGGRVSSQYEEETNQIRDVYRGIWRDYFLAVMLRRRMTHRSRTFQRSVVAGQVVLLVALVCTFAGGLRVALHPTPPEHVAIERWIDQETDSHKITRWFPTEADAEGQGQIVQVQYRYQKESRRWVHTDRRFRVVGELVTELSE